MTAPSHHAIANGSAAPSPAPMAVANSATSTISRAIDGENAAARGAERLHRPDHVALARQVARDRIRHADAADNERGQGDEREELGEALDIAFELRRGLVARADFPAGVGERGLRLLFDRCHGAIARVGRGQAQPVLPAHQTAGLQKSARAQRRLADEHARPKADPAGELVRLADQRRAQLDHGVADGDPVAGFEIEPREQRRIDGGAEGVVLPRQQGRQRHGGVGHDRSEQRIGVIDRLDLDQRRPLPSLPRMRGRVL